MRACVRACVRSHARTAVVMVSVLRRKRESKMQSVCHAYIHAHVHTRINDGTHLRALWVEQRDQCTCPSIRPPVRPSVVCVHACVHVCVHACVCVRAALLGRIGAVGIRRTHGSSLCMRTFVHARVVRILICGVWHLSCKECCECCVIKLHLRALCVRACVAWRAWCSNLGVMDVLPHRLRCLPWAFSAFCGHGGLLALGCRAFCCVMRDQNSCFMATAGLVRCRRWAPGPEFKIMYSKYRSARACVP